MISAVINVRNGMPKLENTLRSLRGWVDEIVVVDMQSTDGSREACVAAGARLFDFEPVGYADPARGFAVAQATSEWALIVDADEMIPRALRDRLMAIAREDIFDVVSIAEENWFFGTPLHHSGWQPDVDRHYRFFRRSAVSFPTGVHSVPILAPGARTLRLPYERDLAIAHFSYPSVTAFVERMNRYTSIEAEELSRNGNPTIRKDGVRGAIREVYRRYVRGGGWRADWRGPVLASLMVIYRLLVVVKAQEIRWGLGSGVGDMAEHEIQRLLREFDDLD